MSTSDKIIELKRNLQEKLAIDQQFIKLSFRDDELEDEKDFAYVKDIAHSNCVAVEACEKMIINVLTMSNNNVKLEMETTDTNLDVAKKIGAKENLYKYLVKLMYKGDDLPYDQCLEVLKKKAGSNIVDLVAKERMHVHVEMMSGENVPYEMETTDTMGDIKKAIKAKAGFDDGTLRLFFHDDEQPDDLTLQIIKNRFGANQVALVAKERVNVNVKLGSGAQEAFDMLSVDTVLDVKKALQKKDHVNAYQVHLMLNGKEVRDD